MPICCPEGHGCNDPTGKESCALILLRAAAPEDKDAAKALDRWRLLVRSAEAGSGERERRFRRRAFERSRNRALIGLAMGPARGSRRRDRKWRSGPPATIAHA
jgi:hypothetical protein